MFSEPLPPALLAALTRASVAWRGRARWRELQRNGMRLDFSWRTGAQRYCDLYRALIAAA